MGRGRIPMELIQKEKARNITYQKRKNGLMKKVGEFSTLCGIDVCLIIDGPNMEGQEPKLETWPHDSEEVHRIIDKYHSTTVDRRPKVYDVEEYYKDRMRKVETEISRVHKEKLKLMYPIWDDSFNALGEQQLRMFVSMLDAKLDACNQRINMLKTKPHTLANSHLPIEPQLFPPPMKPIYQTDHNNMLPIYPFLGQSSQSPMLHNYDHNSLQLMDSVNQVDAVTCDPKTGILKTDGAENNHNTSPFPYSGNMQTIMPSGITQYGDFETSFLHPLNGFCDANMPQPPMFNNMHGSK